MIGIIALVFIICWYAWHFMPVRFLYGVEPEEIAVIKVSNGNNGNEFEITDPEDISYIVSNMKQIAFRKKTTADNIDYWYCLIFINEKGEGMDSLSIQNRNCIRKDTTSKEAVYYFCNGELSEVGDYLESLESALFPDYNKDPDFFSNETKQ